MPSPIAHLGVGYAIYRHYKEKLPQDRRSFWKLPLQLILVTGLSMLPDLDVIPAVIFRDMRAYHNNISHSLFVGIPVALLIAGIFQRIYRSNFWLWFVICLISYDLHVIMDALTADRGVMMFYPLTEARYASPMKLFYGLQWGLGWFSPWHLWTIFTESVFVGIVLVAMNYFDRQRNHVQEKHR
jgi:membrane-bound metal-dependent hydrolase YbcI (DUF457 family)